MKINKYEITMRASEMLESHYLRPLPSGEVLIPLESFASAIRKMDAERGEMYFVTSLVAQADEAYRLTGKRLREWSGSLIVSSSRTREEVLDFFHRLGKFGVGAHRTGKFDVVSVEML